MSHTRPAGDALARVSVAMPTLDRPGLLVRALSSVLDQRHRELEVTVVDNGSGPETRAVLAAVDDPRVDVVRHDQTVPRTDNYNVALRAGTAPYVAVLADDDEWTPDFLHRAVAVLHARAEIVLVHTGYEVVDLEGEVLYSVPDPSPGPESDVMSGSDYIRWMLAGSRRTQFTGTVLRRSALPPQGFLAEDDVSDDLGLLLRAALRGDVAFVREPLVRVRFHEGTVTARASSGPVTSGYRLGVEHRAQCRDVKLRFLDEHGERLADARQLRRVAHRSFRRHLLVPAARRAVEGAGPVEVLRTAVADVRRDPWCLLDRQTWKWSVAAYREGRRGAVTTTERVRPTPDVAAAAPRVALLGGFGVGNLGNDASLAAVVAMVRRKWPTAQVLVVCPQPDVVRRRLGLPATTVRARRPAARWARSRPGRAVLLPYRVLDVARAFRLVGRVDALVVPGTGILDDYGREPPHGWPLTLATWFAAARLRGRGTALVGIGAGPLGSPVSRRLAHLTSRISQHTSYRDAGSRDFMASAGPAAGGRAQVVPDVALSLRPRVRRPVTAPRRVVAVPVMKYRGWHAGGPTARERAEQHVQVIAAVCLWLLQEGYGVRLVTAGADDAPATEQVAAAVRGAAPEELVSALETAEADDLDALADLLEGATAVVATRYHSVVAALLCGQPTLSIGYAAKNAALMDAVGLGRFCQHADDVDPVLLRRQLTELLEDAANLSERVTDQVRRLRAELGAEEVRLHALLRRRPARR